ncbi:MAG: hypothetical protein WC348_03430 [Patescibacteria group bacterium]|jgi:hypothetical protein
MNKNKVLIPVIVILAVAVLAGGYWAWQRYEQQRLAKQFLSGLAGLGGGNSSDLQKWAENMDALSEIEADIEAERELTPEEKFNAAEELQVDSAFVTNAKSEIGPVISEVFGDMKLSSFLNNYLGMGEDSGMVQFMVKRATTASDLNKLTSSFTSRGYTVITSGVSEGEASLMVSKNNAQYTLTYEPGRQEVTVVIFSEEVTQ